MCVIVIKQQNKALSDSDIKNMWDKNRDGAGIAWICPETRKLKTIKGLNSAVEVIEAVKPLQHWQVFLHFRLATHGRSIADLTHPFGVSTDYGEAVRGEATELVMHNGIISGYGSSAHDSVISDSLDFTMSVLAHLPSIRERVRILQRIQGKFLLLSEAGNGTYYTIGHFSKSDDGHECSNLFWEPHVAPVYSAYTPPASQPPQGEYRPWKQTYHYGNGYKPSAEPSGTRSGVEPNRFYGDDDGLADFEQNQRTLSSETHVQKVLGFVTKAERKRKKKHERHIKRLNRWKGKGEVIALPAPLATKEQITDIAAGVPIDDGAVAEDKTAGTNWIMSPYCCED